MRGRGHHRIGALCCIKILYEGVRPCQLAACGIPAYIQALHHAVSRWKLLSNLMAPLHCCRHAETEMMDAPADNLLLCIDPVMEVVQSSVMLYVYRHLQFTSVVLIQITLTSRTP